MKLGDLAHRVGAELQGDPSVEIHSVATLEEAGPGQVSFLANPKYRNLLQSTRADAVIVGPADRAEGLRCLVSDNPYLAFARVVQLLQRPEHPTRRIGPGAHVHPSARVDDSVTAMPGCCVDAHAEIGFGCVLYPGVYVGIGARLGRDCVLHANAVVRERCILGNRVVLQPGAVVGSDGFGFARDGSRHVKIPQIGVAVIEDDVEVGAGTTIDRAALGETRIGRGTKIDNLVQIGHNVRVGEDCLIVAQVGVSGSTRLGNRVTLAGQVGLVGHITVGDSATVGAQSGVTSDVAPGSVVTGSPAYDHGEFRRIQAAARRLPQMRQKIRGLEMRLAELEAAIRGCEAGKGREEEA